MPDELEDRKCRECGKAIKVAAYIPHDRAHEATGISATAWDGEEEADVHVGWICWDCAQGLYKAGSGAFSGCAGDGTFDCEFHYG